MAKYPISREFFPYTLFKPSLNMNFIRMAQKYMKTPRFIYRQDDIEVSSVMIPSYDGQEIELQILKPKGIREPAPCFIDIHGGGFVFGAVGTHYQHALNYARKARCIVAFVLYRLAPDYPFPHAQEDCYAALCWVHDHAEEIGVDRQRIGIGGDSAGGTLAVVSCLMARDRRKEVMADFTLLLYPSLDGRGISESYRKYTDTPMWSSSLSKGVGPLINPHPELMPLAYRSPVEAETLAGMPEAYIEVAEFDPLHDDGVCYAQRLREEGIEVELWETKGTMHGFDNKVNAPTTQKMVAKRIAYLKKMFDCCEC